jgi:peptidoglycan-associated lipoprotein
MSNHSNLSNKVATGALLLLLAASGCHQSKPAAPPPAATAPDTSALATSGMPTATITADPMTIDAGQSVVLNWRTTNATVVSIDGIGDVAINGTQTVTPAKSTNFHLTAKGENIGTYADVRVTVRVPEIPSTPSTAGADTGAGTGAMTGEAAFHASVQDLFFDYDSYDLRADAHSSITAAARYLSANPSIKILVGGYCDDRGSAEYNITLGENRANAAKTALVSAGVAASRIRVVSYGKEKQFCTEENDSCWQQNRRDQFTIDR